MKRRGGEKGKGAEEGERGREGRVISVLLFPTSSPGLEYLDS